MKKLLLSIMSLSMFFSPVQILANEEEIVEDVVVEEETVVEEVVVDEEEIIETEDDYNVVTTNDGTGYWRKQVDGRWKFQYSNGTYAKDEFLTIGGYNYYFDTNGYMKTGWLKYYIDGETLWFYYESNGHEVSGWKQISGKWYYFEPGRSNIMVRSGFKTINGKQYYFLSSGAMATGVVTDGSQKLLFDQNGVQVKDGWTKIDGYWYFAKSGSAHVGTTVTDGGYKYRFDNDGHMVTGWYKDTPTGEWYYYDEKGHEVSGWKQISGKWYYFIPEYDNYMKIGFLQLGEDWYHFDDHGVMAANKWVNVDGDWYYYDAKGKEVHGWFQQNGKWYYLNEYMMTGFCIIDNTYYHFTEKGVMDANKWVKDSGGNWYYHQANGKQVSGWYKVGTQWYYFNPKNHNIMASDCTIVIDGYTYIFASNGTYKKTTAN